MQGKAAVVTAAALLGSKNKRMSKLGNKRGKTHPETLDFNAAEGMERVIYFRLESVSHCE